MSDLNKDRFFEVAQQRDRERVEGIEEFESTLGCQIYAQELTPEEQDNLSPTTVRQTQDGTVETEVDVNRVKWVILGAVDQDGNQIFTAAEEPKLKKCKGSVINPIFEKVQELTNVEQEEIEGAGRE